MSQHIEAPPETKLLSPPSTEDANKDPYGSMDEVDIYPTGKALLNGMDPKLQEAVLAAAKEMRARIDSDNQVFH